ncbi:MAG: hypothetical protein U0359_01725 [Byssovorax sp.]
MQPASISLPAPLLLLIALGLGSACGARSSLPGDELDAGITEVPADASTGDASPAERACPPECAVGHECCAGSCLGPPVPMPSDCCTCLEGEVSSATCPLGRCVP